ncbi:hypothetical protein [Alienimonas californiensis]|uniref:Uncharacterized protein n=1 Tax=Alienimonas californiensis TaxID=2527989 RepID=A0A517PFB8_9PLAN|nr:hypothetical protein [Alienimonas californiensis]QDT18071.1 hypothetical protein CA12_42100 [Alienimonas californiensis]
MSDADSPLPPPADPEGEPAEVSAPGAAAAAEPPPRVEPRPVTNQRDGLSPPVPPGLPFPPPSNRPVDWAWWLPEVRLLEAPRIALSPVIVALAFAGLVAAAAGDFAIHELIGDARPETVTAFPWDPAPAAYFGPPLPGDLEERPAVRSLLAPLHLPAAGLNDLLSLTDWPQTLRGALRLGWALLVWGFFGTAICRAAAVRFAVGASGSPVAALRMAGGRWISSLGSPLLPAVGLGVLALGLIVLGWAGDLPAVGPWLVAVLWGAALLAGLAAFVLIVLLAIGWPLMIAALAVENSDAFDAFSRAFSYVLGRPLRLVVHVVAGAAIAAVAVLLAQLATTAAALLAAGFAGVGMGPEDLRSLGVTPGAAGTADAAVAGRFWLTLWVALPAAYAAGLFWTLVTVSYFLLRYADDGVETDELWQPDRALPPDDGTVPRFGVSASSMPVIERPHRPTV